MRILGNNSAKLNEIIFANRNKSYGAYAIRSAYNDSLIKSLAYLAGILICVFGTSTYLNRNNSTSDKGVLLLDDVKPEYVTEYTVEPKQPEIVQPVINEPAAAAPSGGAPIIVDYNVVTTTSLNLNNPINGLGTATATGISTTGTATTSNTLVATSPSVDIVDNTEHIVAEEMPEFNLIPNGVLVYVSSNITYPPLAREIGREGTVHVSFVVNQLGEVEGVKILKGIGYGCDEEVLRVINKMPNWKKPGKNNGKPVKVRYNIPVSFRLR